MKENVKFSVVVDGKTVLVTSRNYAKEYAKKISETVMELKDKYKDAEVYIKFVK